MSVLGRSFLLACSLFAPAAIAEDKPAAPGAPAPVAASADVERHARETVDGYYAALIKGDYEQAGTFLHPSEIELLRKSVLKTLADSKSEAQKTATLTALGVADQPALETMPAARFFGHYARSSYGFALRGLALKEARVAVAITKVTCTNGQAPCEVRYDLTYVDDKAMKQTKRQALIADRFEGRWVARTPPPPPAPPGKH
jgi:hypothetical protein